MIKIVLQVSEQASIAHGVCEVWKQELYTLIAIISGLPPLGFLQTTQLISLVVFIWQIPRRGNCLFLPVTGYSHADMFTTELS